VAGRRRRGDGGRAVGTRRGSGGSGEGEWLRGGRISSPTSPTEKRMRRGIEHGSGGGWKSGRKEGAKEAE